MGEYDVEKIEKTSTKNVYMVAGFEISCSIDEETSMDKAEEFCQDLLRKKIPAIDKLFEAKKFVLKRIRFRGDSWEKGSFDKAVDTFYNVFFKDLIGSTKENKKLEVEE
jgi:hypothetical protein